MGTCGFAYNFTSSKAIVTGYVCKPGFIGMVAVIGPGLQGTSAAPLDLVVQLLRYLGTTRTTFLCDRVNKWKAESF